VTVREKRDVPFDGARPRDHAIHPRYCLFGGFATRAAVAEKHPPGRLRIDLFRSQSFVFAIVPFHQITIDFCVRAETG
jgi:hypothetical protein